MSEMKVQAEAGYHEGLGGDTWGVGSAGGQAPGLTPPGFKSSSSSGDDDPRAQGGSMGAAISAHPPPGFKTDNPRLPSGQGALWSHEPRDAKGMGGSGNRSNSFTDLAAALGSGLAESMEDATRGEHRGGALLTDNFFNPKDDLSYARQSRHAASRLLGSSPSKDAFGPSHTAPEAGSLFASLDSGERGYLKKSNASHPLFGDIENDTRKGPKDTSSGLTAAFSNDSANRDRMSGDFRPSYHSNSSSSLYDAVKEDSMKSRLPATKDLGMTVTEPSDSYGRGASSGRSDDGTYGIQRDMQNLWPKTDERSPHKNRETSGGSLSVDLGSDSQMQAEEDLRPFTWDVRHHDTSRALAILRAASLPANEVRSICESFGVVENFRSDFSDRGVFFVTYYDMRCAQYAAMEMQSRLQRLESGSDRAFVQFCVPLNSSSQNDESLVVLTDVPSSMNIEHLASMLSSYGAVRSLKSLGGNYGGSSFVVEFHDVQDAKQAVLELESTQPWGPDVGVEVGARNPSDRKRGRELLALIGRWRHGGSSQGSGGGQNRRQPGGDPRMYGGPSGQSPRGMGNRPPSPETAHTSYIPGARHDVRYDRGGHGEPAPQLVLGPDGRYSYVHVVNHHPSYPPPPHYGERVVHSSHGTYVTHVNPSSGYQQQQQQQHWPPQTHHFSGGGSVVSASSYGERSHQSGPYPSGSRSVPFHGDGGSVGSHSHRMSMPHPSTASTSDDRDNRHLTLDLDLVESGRDSRTSLMVRNIPNKYTQQMLLNEFNDHGHGPGVIDFFYLPIDFKNRCNRGYAFINFVDYRDIIPFHRQYYGKHWRTFNSDKICDITYARIQGKSAMLKRFENSALMEKDEEYKPLVFTSHGPEKGTRLPFPDPNTK